MDEPRGTGQLERLRAGNDAAGNVAAHRAPIAVAAAGPTAGPTAGSTLIQFSGVGHTYVSLLGRSVRAVDDFSLEIGDSEVFGLAGPNGAGKSTLISLLLGYLEPTNGAVRIAGLRPRAFVERHGIGYLSELIAIPPKWSVEQALARFGILAGVPPEQLRERTERAIEAMGLDEQRGKRVKQLSKGNLQRLGLAQALLRDERVLILDEPTHGLDPVWTQRFRDVVESLRRPGRVIFIASHNLDELQRLADRVAIIDHGKLQRVVEPRGASAGGAVTPYIITVVGDGEVVREVFAGALPSDDGRTTYDLPAMPLTELNAGLAALVARGVLVADLRPAHSVLEQHFREAVGGGGGDDA
jgi:ABC-2 type transport system ATP-binding protein